MLLQSVLLAMTGMVLLVVCLNISGMMQVRSAMRERELSVRQAIGAGRGRLVQYLLSEAVILSALGGALSTIVLFNIPSFLSWWIGQPIPAEWAEALHPNLYVAALCIAVCLATSLVFGLLPALRFSRPAIISSLKDDAGGGGHRVGRVQRVAVGLQIGIAIPFLVLSGTLVDRVRSTATADLGFETDGLAAVRLDLDPQIEKTNPGFFIRTVQRNLEADFVAAELGQAQEQLLLPLAQHPSSTVFLFARTAAGDEPTVKITAAFQNAVRDLEADFRAPTVLTCRELRERSRRAFLTQSAGVGAPGGVVLGLAALGIYGVVGFMVATRTREMALRMALGASRQRVMGKVLFDVVKLVMPGVAGGLLIAGIVVRMFRQDLGLPLSNVEHLAYVAAAAVAVLVAVVASLATARRAASVAPMVAMRSE
jgi:predicted lysophospholipase L1 biosynthesis ABC-type transport system permease subunit